ncbi:RICIN domain-containing protein [Microcoleus sp. S13_B4]|uniref:RICIN domain-containing protein n=1 Tax=Microcoleus sp. S13_B4 TaxID=3055408 RepID=UPI002FD73A1E
MNLKRFLCYSAICLTVVCVYASPGVLAQQARGRLIRNQLSGKCLDVSGYPGTANGTPLILYDCETSDPETDQRWIMTSRGFIQNQLSGKCLDVSGYPGTANGTPLILYDCETSDPNTDQRWIMTSRGFIQNQLSGKCIDVAGAPGQQNGAQLILWDCETSERNGDNGSVTDQRWSQ